MRFKRDDIIKQIHNDSSLRGKVCYVNDGIYHIYWFNEELGKRPIYFQYAKDIDTHFKLCEKEIRRKFLKTIL